MQCQYTTFFEDSSKLCPLLGNLYSHFPLFSRVPFLISFYPPLSHMTYLSLSTPPFKFISFLFPFFLSRSVSHFPLIRYRLTVLILPSCELFLNPPPSLTYPLLFPISFSPCYSLILLFSSFIPSSLVYLLIPFFPLSLLSPVPSFHTHPTSARPLPPPFPIFSKQVSLRTLYLWWGVSSLAASVNPHNL